MSALSSSSILLLLLLSLSGVDPGLFAHGVVRCQYSSRDGHDAVYIEQYYFNKMLLVQYNSTLGNFTGYTEKGKEIADALNKNPHFLEQEKKKMERNCRSYISEMYTNILDKTVKPYIKLRSVEPDSSRHPAMLVCSVYDFYPKAITVTWLRNGKEVTSNVTSTEELRNGNWLYQIHSHWEYTPTAGEKITCMVEHASLVEPMIKDWDPMLESEMNKISLGTAGLLLGLVFVAAGLIYYKRKSTGGRTLVPTG
ncbi:H-2 class II histocompatibility antigen, E-S beta chain-like [Polymixia lowei]